MIKGVTKDIKYYVVIGVTILLYSFFYINRTVTDVEGWDSFCIELMRNGKMIYRDFYYYVPPVYLLRYGIVWILFDGSLMAIRVFGILDRIILYCLIFYVLGKFSDKKTAFVVTILGYFFYNSLAFNNYGDYTQYSQIFLMLTAIAFAFAYNVNNINTRKCYMYLCIGGFFSLQCVMCKQSIGLIAVIAFLLYILLYSFVYKAGYKVIYYVTSFLAGVFIGAIPYIVWFGMTGAWNEFISQVFFAGVASKGISVQATSSENSQIIRTFRTLFCTKSITYICGMLATITFSRCYNKYKSKLCRVGMYICGVLLGIYALHNLNTFSFLKKIGILIKNVCVCSEYCLAIVLLLTSVITIWIRKRKLEEHNYYIFAISLIAILASGILYSLKFGQVQAIYSSINLNDYNTNFYEICFWICNVWLLYQLYKKIRNEEVECTAYSWAYIVAADINAFVSLYGGGDGKYATNGSLFTVPFAIYIVIKFLQKNEVLRSNVNFVIYKVIVPTVIGLMAIITMAMRIVVPYSWWGWVEEPITESSNYEINYERYNGILCSKRDKVVIEEVTKLVEKNSDKDDFVLTFPYSKMYNILADRMYTPTFVPVYYFDVCSDEYAVADLEIIKKEMPEIIVWKDLGEECWKQNEISFRGGNESGQRKIKEWFESVKDTEYTLAGKVYNQSVYVLKGKEIKYTFFANEENLQSKLNEVNPPIFGIYKKYKELLGKNGKKISIYEIFVYQILLLGTYMVVVYKAKKMPDIMMMLIIILGCYLEMRYVYWFVLVIPGMLYLLNKKEKFDYAKIIILFICMTAMMTYWNSEIWSYTKYIVSGGIVALGGLIFCQIIWEYIKQLRAAE